jgi:F-type H+-transporting ATPase subunit b
MNIIPNPYLIAIQFVPFLLAAIALYQIIFKPMLAYLDERSTMTDGAKAEAAALLEKVQSQIADYESQLAKANAEVRTIRASRRVEAMKVYNAKVDEARKAAEGQVSAALAEMEVEQTEARATLQGTVGSLADQIAGNILQNLAS